MSDTEDDEKAALYKSIVELADPLLVAERMRALGFWPSDEPVPTESPETLAERSELEDRVRRLQKKAHVAGDPELALRAERIRRWEESKRRRALRKVEKAAQEKARREAWLAHKERALVHLGDGVSAGLSPASNFEADKAKTTPAKVARLRALELPEMHTGEDLAAAAGIDLPTLRWLTYHRRAQTLVHYHRYSTPKKTGGVRQISAPKPRLAALQRWVLEAILARVPVSPSAHGFVRARSIVTGAAPHVGRAIVVNMDLLDFFPSVGFRRVKGLFGALGYGEHISTVLALICTEPPRAATELDGVVYQVALSERRLPQGACTSPTIANLVCRRLDKRLEGAASSNGFAYTRYADDLTFSADDDSRLPRLLYVARRAIREEGFAENPAKTRLMRRGACQEVTGLVVNGKLNVGRKERRRLRAVLHEAKTHGLAKANRENRPRFREHLLGMIAYVGMVNAPQGAKLRALYDEIPHD